MVGACVCAEIVAPMVETCPSGPLVYTSHDGRAVRVARPDVSFRSALRASGGSSPPTLATRCSHFVDGRTQWLDVGQHVVTCTARDPLFGDRAVAQCVFTVHVQGCASRVSLLAVAETNVSAVDQNDRT